MVLNSKGWGTGCNRGFGKFFGFGRFGGIWGGGLVFGWRRAARLAVVLGVLLGYGAAGSAQELTVRIDKPGPAIQPTMWGIFFEDINMAADGGLYAELVKNRSFEFSEPMMGWKGKALVINRSVEMPDNPRFVRVEGGTTLVNEGFRGMGIKQGEMYHFSVWNKGEGSLAVELQGASGAVIGNARLALGGASGWHKDTVSFVATATEPKAHLNVRYEGKGTADLDLISLFPQHTWKERPGGLRADLVQLLADLHPGFIRFPGGCIVEGRTLDQRYQWKKTVGKVEDRKLIVNRWNTEFAHRPTPDYFQSFGLGFFEYFQLAEDIGASPLPILNCGMACQFNSSEVVPVEAIDPYIQDALDLIEFANGPVSSKWGALRASMGHPAPFGLKMMGVGNEQWGPQYVERYKVFSAAIKARYPEVRLVNSVGPNPDGELFDFLNDTLRKMHADILDEHYYRNPDWFLQQARRYDNYDRSGPRIFAGEYAAQSDKVVSVNNKNNWRSAISEAAFMTGLERNADVVQMASYAPLFAHVEGWQWTPDLIWFDNLRSYGTPDYYVQKLFANNRGSVVVPLVQGGAALTGQGGLYGSACLDKGTGELIVKLVNAGDGEARPVILVEGKTGMAAADHGGGAARKRGTGTITVLKAGLEDVNTLDAPMAVSPVEGAMLLQGNKMTPVLAGHSMAVIRIKI